MADTTFNSGTVVTASWLNDINNHVYNGKSLDNISVINVKDPTYGAVGNGVTDDTAAIQAAIDSSYGADVYFPPGTYRVTAPLLLNTQGAILRGGNHRVTTLMIDQTTGPGINISQPYCQVIGLTVKASTTRQAYTTGSTYELVPNLFGIQIYNNGGYLTQTRIERVWSFGHPNNGFYMGGEGADSMFINCAAYSNRGHGFYFDGRALLGGTASRCGLVSLIHCRGTDNGGNALFADDPAAMCYRMWIYSFETIKNAWNTAIAGLVNAELHIGGENQHLQQCAQSDENGDTATIMDQGLWPRLAKATASVGIFIGAECGGITITQNRFIGTRKGVETALTVDRLHLYVRGAYFSHQKTSSGLSLQSRGFDIGADYKCLDIECEAAMPVSIMVSTPTTGGRIKIGNDEYIIYGASLGSLFALRLYRDATIASEAVNAQSAYINLLATATTDLKAISFAGILNPLPSGMTVHFYNASAYTITLINSLSPGFIRTVSGTDTPVLPGRGFSIRVSPAGDPHEI